MRRPIWHGLGGRLSTKYKVCTALAGVSLLTLEFLEVYEPRQFGIRDGWLIRRLGYNDRDSTIDLWDILQWLGMLLGVRSL